MCKIAYLFKQPIWKVIYCQTVSAWDGTGCEFESCYGSVGYKIISYPVFIEKLYDYSVPFGVFLVPKHYTMAEYKKIVFKNETKMFVRDNNNIIIPIIILSLFIENLPTFHGSETRFGNIYM